MTFEPLLTAKEVQKLLNVSLPLVYQMAERGDLPCIRWGGILRFKKEDIFEFLDRHYKTSKEV